MAAGWPRSRQLPSESWLRAQRRASGSLGLARPWPRRLGPGRAEGLLGASAWRRGARSRRVPGLLLGALLQVASSGDAQWLSSDPDHPQKGGSLPACREAPSELPRLAGATRVLAKRGGATMCQAWPPLALEMQTASQDALSLRASSTLPHSAATADPPVAGGRDGRHPSKTPRHGSPSEAATTQAGAPKWLSPTIHLQRELRTGRSRSRRGRQQRLRSCRSELGPDSWLGCSPVKQRPEPVSGRSRPWLHESDGEGRRTTASWAMPLAAGVAALLACQAQPKLI